MRILRTLVGALFMVVLVAMWNGCGGGGAAAPPSQYILLQNGKVEVEQGEGRIIIKAGVSQLPGVGFTQDVVIVQLYQRDGFQNPRSDLPSPSDFIQDFRVSRDGTLLDELRLPVGVYTAVAENIHVRQGNKEFRSGLTAFVFEVFKSGGRLHTTLPVAFEAKFPALGSVIEDSYVRFRTDLAAVGGRSSLFLQHRNGTVDMHRQLEPWPPDTNNPSHANVSFDALRGGPTLGDVQRLILKAFKP